MHLLHCAHNIKKAIQHKSSSNTRNNVLFFLLLLLLFWLLFVCFNRCKFAVFLYAVCCCYFALLCCHWYHLGAVDFYASEKQKFIYICEICIRLFLCYTHTKHRRIQIVTLKRNIYFCHLTGFYINKYFFTLNGNINERVVV